MEEVIEQEDPFATIIVKTGLQRSHQRLLNLGGNFLMRSKIFVWFKISSTECLLVVRGRHDHFTTEKLDNASTG